MNKIGDIVALQVQRDRIKIKGVEYLPQLIQQVDEACLSGGGMLGNHQGSWLIDVHHPFHPASKGNAHRAVSFGFTSHYAAMRERFGNVPDYIAGENIIVHCDRVISPEEAASGFVIRTAEGDIEFAETHVLAPCREFTSHLLGLPEPADKGDIADDIAFLHEGMRGFGTGFAGGPITIEVGAEVWVQTP